MKYRSRFDIVGVLLESAARGATKTKLMYEAFLSHSQVEEYLDFLESKSLISLAQDKKHYLPTEKGLRFLAMYEKIKDAVAVMKEQAAPLETPASMSLNEPVKHPSRHRQAGGVVSA
jgi:predicted transcriptional regulator